jgi:hypothetical protein
LHATALAPTTNLADALALISLRRAMPRGFEYGWVRVAGSAAFIVAFCRMAIASQGLSVVIWMQALLMLTVEYHQYADCRAAASRSAQLALLSISVRIALCSSTRRSRPNLRCSPICRISSCLHTVPQPSSQADANQPRAHDLGMGDATGLKVVDTPAGRLGCLICWESYMPLEGGRRSQALHSGRPR